MVLYFRGTLQSAPMWPIKWLWCKLLQIIPQFLKPSWGKCTPSQNVVDLLCFSSIAASITLHLTSLTLLVLTTQIFLTTKSRVCPPSKVTQQRLSRLIFSQVSRWVASQWSSIVTYICIYLSETLPSSDDRPWSGNRTVSNQVIGVTLRVLVSGLIS